MPGPPPEHGTRSKYVRGCRCHKCRKANYTYLHDRKQRLGQTGSLIPRNQNYYAAVHLRWPAEPATRLQPKWSATQWAEAAGCEPRTWWRWLNDGIPDDASDRLAIHLGMHPIEIWPTWIDQAPQLIRKSA